MPEVSPRMLAISTAIAMATSSSSLAKRGLGVPMEDVMFVSKTWFLRNFLSKWAVSSYESHPEPRRQSFVYHATLLCF